MCGICAGKYESFFKIDSFQVCGENSTLLLFFHMRFTAFIPSSLINCISQVGTKIIRKSLTMSTEFDETFQFEPNYSPNHKKCIENFIDIIWSPKVTFLISKWTPVSRRICFMGEVTAQKFCFEIC